LPRSNIDEFTLNAPATAGSDPMALVTIVNVIAFHDHYNKQETPMRIRSTLLAIVAIAAVATTSFTPANAYEHSHRSFARTSHYFSFVKPGVNLCKRGIVYICQ
jgi:hypothetical protein